MVGRKLPGKLQEFTFTFCDGENRGSQFGILIKKTKAVQPRFWPDSGPFRVRFGSGLGLRLGLGVGLSLRPYLDPAF